MNINLNIHDYIKYMSLCRKWFYWKGYGCWLAFNE